MPKLSRMSPNSHLILKPPKCVSLILNRNKPDKISYHFQPTYYDGKTRNMSSGPTRFLGQTQSYSSFTTTREDRTSHDSSSKYIRHTNSISELQTNAKLTLLSSITTAQDPLVSEVRPLQLTLLFQILPTFVDWSTQWYRIFIVSRTSLHWHSIQWDSDA